MKMGKGLGKTLGKLGKQFGKDFKKISHNKSLSPISKCKFSPVMKMKKSRRVF